MKQYEVGDYVMHENAGVCQVAAIEERALQGKGSEKLYYSLEPVFQDGSQVITPVDAGTGKIRIRDVKSKEEMEAILSELELLDVIEEKDDRVRAERVKEEIALFDPRPLAGVVKTAYLRKAQRIRDGKRVMSADEKILQTAGKKLFQEMAFVLHLEMSEVEDTFYEGLRSTL